MQSNLQKQKPEKHCQIFGNTTDDKGANKLTKTKILAPPDISVIQIQK